MPERLIIGKQGAVPPIVISSSTGKDSSYNSRKYGKGASNLTDSEVKLGLSWTDIEPDN
jgi:hypothetical protein